MYACEIVGMLNSFQNSEDHDSISFYRWVWHILSFYVSEHIDNDDFKPRAPNLVQTQDLLNETPPLDSAFQQNEVSFLYFSVVPEDPKSITRPSHHKELEVYCGCKFGWILYNGIRPVSLFRWLVSSFCSRGIKYMCIDVPRLNAQSFGVVSGANH